MQFEIAHSHWIKNNNEIEKKTQDRIIKSTLVIEKAVIYDFITSFTTTFKLLCPANSSEQNGNSKHNGNGEKNKVMHTK